jgi:hypothetical protein
VAELHPAVVPAGGELEPCERVDGDRVDLDAPHVAERNAGVASLEQPADARAEPGQVGPGNRSCDV